MPSYVCRAALGRLTPVQKAKIVDSITTIHHEETGAARYFVMVTFHDIGPDNCYVADRPAPADQIFIHGEIRSGRTKEQKSRMLRRIMQDVGGASGATEDAVWVYLAELPAENLSEYGRILTSPGGGGCMVLVVIRRREGKAQGLGLTNSKR